MTGGAVEAAQSTARPARRSLRGVGLLYVSFGATFGFLQGGLPPILRERGVDLMALGWMFVLYIPLGLTFLWAPIVDTFRPLPMLARRVDWIVLMQALTVLLMLAVAFAGQASSALLFLLGLAIAFTSGTMDLALDAFAAEQFAGADRSVAAAMKVGLMGGGAIIGGGAFVTLYDILGWRSLMLAAAGFTAVCGLPLFGLDVRLDNGRETAATSTPLTGRAPVSTLLRRLGMLSIATTILIGATAFDRVLMVDLGVPLKTVGGIVGTVSPLMNCLVAFCVEPVSRRIGSRQAYVILVIIAVSATAALCWAISVKSVEAIIVASVVQTAAVAGLSVRIYALLLDWAQGGRAATSYAILCGGSRLVATAGLFVIPMGIEYIGWPAFFNCIFVLLILQGVMLVPAANVPCRH